MTALAPASMLSSVLPLLAPALVLVVIVDAVVVRFGRRRLPRLATAALLLVAMLVPWGAMSLAATVRGFVGDASISSLAVLVGCLLARLGPESVRRRLGGHDHQLTWLAAILVAVALVFYPLSLGATRIDPYSAGFYPSVLTALLLALLICAALAGWWIAAGLIALAYAGFAGRWLESDNLWDYLFDVPLVAVALVWLVLRWRTIADTRWSWLTPRRLTIGALVLAGTFVGFAVVLNRVNPQDFIERFAVEDGFVEWGTSIALFIGFVVSVRRFFGARRRFTRRGRLILLFIAFVCLFGAGEEISWGQRVFGIETPETFKESNAQQEFNLHNLTFEWRGQTIKINRLIFGRGLTLALVVYLLVMGPLYRYHPGFRRLIDRWAIPIPTATQTIAYIVVVSVVESLIDSPKRGEMTEFAGAIVFLLNVALPLNRHIYGGPVEPPRGAAVVSTA
ncbi:MAG: hypothetical protein ABWZ78_17740 [Burkholderiaceae bacterium]